MAEIQENIRRACSNRSPGESYNRANERLVEEFIVRLRHEFSGRTYEVRREPRSKGSGRSTAETLADDWQQARTRRDAPCVVIEREKLSRWAVRTTRWNFIFTVPGESPDIFLLVAHYDTWRGPGADDNTTGEEILKQYLLADLRDSQRPGLTHVYFLAGSEECGLIGLLSQLLVALGLNVGVQALQQQSFWLLGLALALCPLASYRFGVAGSREYVRALSSEELERIRAVVSIDSVGEGRLFIPRSTLGADFIRALVPFGDYDAFTDVLEEGAHLHGIKYNNYLAGGTTDHLSFLEVNNGLWARATQGLRREWARLTGGHYRAARQIPASALVAMQPGKASPLVFGGKLHTPQDIPERVHDQPLMDALLVTDYLFHIVEGGERVREPRDLNEFHYARVYEVARPGRRAYWLALRDAVEPNRRNLNAVYGAAAVVDEVRKEATVDVGEIVGWGVDTRLREDVAELAAAAGYRYKRVRIDRLTVRRNEQVLLFARNLTPAGQLRRRVDRAVAWLERSMGRYVFITFFAAGYLLAFLTSVALDFGFRHSDRLRTWFLDYPAITLPLVLVLQLAVLVFLMARQIPTWIDNHYKHENRADNLGSLRRQPKPARAESLKP
ncbi:MAG: M28 family peptidase [Candidatus Rokubacteria bacterium]|nr:M28 family peptidase [Candidatus Rokubacteria bacterium]